MSIDLDKLEYEMDAHGILHPSAIDALLSRCRFLEDQLAEAREVLREVEWGGTDIVGGEGEPCCPLCELWEGIHAPGCRLAALLSPEEEAPPSGAVGEERDFMRDDCPRNWTKDFSHENGDYMCRCMTCKRQFRGHKRRFACRECAPEKPCARCSSEKERDALKARVAELEEAGDSMSKWIRNRGLVVRDHACPQCMTDGYSQDLVCSTFVCGYHAALASRPATEGS